MIKCNENEAKILTLQCGIYSGVVCCCDIVVIVILVFLHGGGSQCGERGDYITNVDSAWSNLSSKYMSRLQSSNITLNKNIASEKNILTKKKDIQ